MLPIKLEKASNVTLTINGHIWACEDYEHWPAPDGRHYTDLFTLTDLTNFKIQGNGVVDG
jgi:hypothetical protein